MEGLGASGEGAEYPFPTQCNPMKDRMQDMHEAWNWLGRITIAYDWKYRKKICAKCPLETQKRLECYRVDNFEMVDGERIQETHCSKLERARENRLRNHVNHVFEMSPFGKP